MKITIRNLGVIKKAEINLKPLTILVGPNNSGKTWLAYTLASIFGPYAFSKYLKTTEEREVPPFFSPIDKAVEQITNKGSAVFDLLQFASEYGKAYFNDVAQTARYWMPEYMSTQTASFENLAITINLDATKKSLSERVFNYYLRSQIAGGRQQPLLNIRKNRGDSKLYIYTSIQFDSAEDYPVEEQIVEQLPPDLIKETLLQTIFEILHRSLYPHVRILPTERTTFITFPSSSRTKDGLIELTIEKKPAQDQKMRTVSAPVSFFLDMINSTLYSESEKARRESSIKGNQNIKYYTQLAQLLEKQILSGEVQISQPESDLTQEGSLSQESAATREVLFQPTKDCKLEISIASSMVKELSPLVLYLRYLARPGELLIIDEPEMNLHPEAQAKMIEFLAMLINAGLNIIITTHSPYVTDHLTNLIKAYDAEDKDSIRGEFYLKRTEAFISKEKVSVYLVDRGKATKAIDEDGVIQLNTFGEVPDRISEIYFKL